MSNYGNNNYNEGGYQQSNYNAGGGYNSGGFVASQTTPGGAGEGRKGGNNALRPVTIQQILEATQAHPDADFKIDDVEVSAMTFCGRVVNVSHMATNTTYKIDDSTGSIEAKVWIEAGAGAAAAAARQEEESTGANAIQHDSWVKVLGSLRSFAQKQHIAVSGIRLVQHEKEAEYHALEAKYATLYFTRGPIVQPSAAGNGLGGGGVAGVGHDGAGHESSELASKLSQLDPFSRKVMEIIHASPDTNEGVNVRTLQGMIGGGGNLLATIESLKEDGHLYTTMDDDHVKSTMI